MRHTFVAAAGFILVSGIAIAGDQNHDFLARGQGNSSCGMWLQARHDQSAMKYVLEAWLDGFVSSYNDYAWSGRDVAKNADEDGIDTWVDNYCASHPLDSVAEAATKLIIELRRRNQR